MNKSEILNSVKEILSQKVLTLQKLIDETRASNSETKSSIGDKYETGREMLQQEINNLQIQLNSFSESMGLLKNIQPVEHQIAGLGSLVETDRGKFFVAVSLGEVKLDGEKIFVISAESPIAKAMHGKKQNETFIVNNFTQTILKIW